MMKDIIMKIIASSKTTSDQHQNRYNLERTSGDDDDECKNTSINHRVLMPKTQLHKDLFEYKNATILCTTVHQKPQDYSNSNFN